ncbi:MAG: hypothetical protein JSW54_03065, partial [Fidelibacterota bacterium]
MSLKIKGILLAGAIWVAFLVLATSLSAGTGAGDNEIFRSFDVGYGGTLTVDTERGSIEVTTARAEKVEVEITRKVLFGRGGDADEILEDFDIKFKHSGKDVSIYAESKHDWDWLWDNVRLRIHYAITVPERYNLDLNTSGGSIEISDLEGEVECKTSGG